MVATLLILVIMTLVLIISFQTSSVNLLVSQNYLDQPTALSSALACERHKTRELLFDNLSSYALANPGGMSVNCSTTTPIVVQPTSIIPGASASLKQTILRFQTTASGRRNSSFNTLSDVRKVVNVVQAQGG